MGALISPASPPYPCHSVYLVSTPYHVLLAHVVASHESPGDHSVLVMKEGRAHFYELFESIRGDRNVPFTDVLFLRQPATGKLNKRPRNVKRRATAARELLESLQPRNLYLFSDTYLEQFLAVAGKQTGASIYYVEDGAAAYSTHKKEVSGWTHFKNRVAYGSTYRQVETEGTSAIIGTVLAAYPRHLRQELKAKDCIELPRTAESVFSGLTWPESFLDSLGVDTTRLRCERLYVLGYSGLFRHIRNYHSLLGDILKKTLGPEPTAVKYHPRETTRDPLGLRALGVEVIHQSVPAEILYYLNRDKLRFVYGDIGTSLITARWFLPQTSVVSFMDSLSIRDDTFRGVLREIGVDIV